jgi:hypothetical protein
MDISRFIRVYANLPIKLRDQIVVVIDDKPMTWNAVYLELEQGTELGKKALQMLEEMEII